MQDQITDPIDTDLIQGGEFTEPEHTDVEFEADREEYMGILRELLPAGIPSRHINDTVRASSEALAELLMRATPEDDGSHRCEIHDGIIVVLRHVPESTGTDPNGNEYTEAEHLAAHVKFTSGALAAIERAFGIECKNG